MSKSVFIKTDPPIMECQCAADGVTMLNEPVCITHSCRDIADPQPEFKGRTAKCVYCGKEKPSSTSLAFFELKINKKQWDGKPYKRDRFYCGCRGWN